MLSFIDKTCPNFISYYCRICAVYLSKKLGKKQKSYDGINELQEEEFSITSLPQDQIRSHEETMNSPQASLHTFVYPADTHAEEKAQAKSRDVHMHKFTINLEPYDKYYEMLEEKTQNIEDLFLSQSNPVEDIASENNRTSFRVSEIPSNSGFKFIFTYQLPCSYSFFHNTNSSFKTVSLFSRNIQNYELMETVHPNLSIYSLSFKKILGLGLEPRNFTYLKYVNNATARAHWEVVMSLSSGGSSRSGVKEAEVFSVSYIEEREEDGSPVIEVKTFLDLDLKSIIRAPKIVVKGLKEAQHYLENFYEHATKNYHEESV